MTAQASPAASACLPTSELRGTGPRSSPPQRLPPRSGHGAQAADASTWPTKLRRAEASLESTSGHEQHLTRSLTVSSCLEA